MTVGVLLLENTHVQWPGALGRTDTFDPPSLIETVPGAWSERVLADQSLELARAYQDAARSLIERGATLITSNCGFCHRYQERVREVGVTVALSSLLLLDLLRAVFGRLGVMTYDARALARLEQPVSWPADVPVAEIGNAASWAVLNETDTPVLDREQMEAELQRCAAAFAAEHQLRALLLECTAMLPFKRGLELALGVPCFDVVDLIALVGRPREWEGIRA